jgi:5S rRNA maturation endonuclease (ribonuclease M5)
MVSLHKECPMPIQDFLARLTDVRPTGENQWSARCPAHDDEKASLSVAVSDDGKILLHCHAGCETKKALAAFGLTFADLAPEGSSRSPEAVYDYRDADGNLVHQTVRFPGKQFRQRRPDGNGGWIWNLKDIKLLLYCYPELLAADPAANVFIVEGEKDVDSLRALGTVATCNPMGAGKWAIVAEDAVKALTGRSVVVIADKDEPGRKHAQDVAGSLRGHAAAVKVVELPGDNVKDASDFIVAGGTVADLLAIAEAAPLWETTGDADGDRGDNRGKKSQAQVMVERFNQDASAKLFHNSEQQAFATFAVKDHRETWRVGSRQFQLHLRWLYFNEKGKGPNSTAVTEAQGTLEAQAIFAGPCEEVYIRVAGDGIDLVYLDLCDPEWQVVEMSALTRTYRVLSDAPVHFIRARGMQALPIPERGGDLLELRRLINIGSDDNWALLLAWMVAALRPMGPYPVLVIHGEQGACKSTLEEIIRTRIDPNKANLRAEPTDTRDLAIAASNEWVQAFDNLSHMRPWLSDAFCRLSTGGGLKTRELFSNDLETIFDAQRPVMLNGIEEVATRGDLLDRCIAIELEPITGKRRQLSEVWADVNASAGKILGALCEAVVHALRTHRDVHLDDLPRMADFAVWATAAEPALGLAPGTVMAAYNRNRATANDVALESSQVASLVIAMVREQGKWTGTATQLLEAIDGRADDQTRRAKWWPKSSRAVAGALRRLAPNLRVAGIEVTFGRGTGHDRQRQITLATAHAPVTPPAPPEQPDARSAAADVERQGPSDEDQPRGHNRPTQPSDEKPNEIKVSDDTDVSDDVAADFAEFDL